MSRQQLVALCLGFLAAWLGVVLLGSIPSRADSGRSSFADRSVILVSLDGFAHFYLDDPRADIPTLRRMIREGAVADRGMECSFPTVTWPNHTTLVTGVPPAKHGVLGNVVFDRAKGDTVQLLVDPVLDKDEIVKVPTIYDVAHAAGLKTAAIIWPATRGAKSLDWTLPDMKSPLFEKYATPGWIDELGAAGVPYDRYGAWVDAKEGGPRRDWAATRAAAIALTKHRANLVLLHLIELDHAEHEFGPRSSDAYWAVSTMDNRLRDLLDAIEAAGLRDQVTVIVSSDHGFFNIERSIHPNVKLRELGLIEVEKDKVVRRPAWSVSQGGGASVYIVDQARRSQIAAQIKKALDGVEGIEAVFEPKDFGKIGQATPDEDKFGADLWLAAKEGYSFSNSHTAEQVVTKNAKRDGTHGFLPHHPDMHGIFVAWGRDIKPATKLGPIKNTQVAPTIARLLGLELPAADGKPLAEMLTSTARPAK
ncbi:MAG: alkaline phosphatase family protein [Planctomycetes bacterium]|nr:alkaline phosphatase family protein [Planctomycetota bacterium]